MKILYITTIGSTTSFFISFIKELLAEGHTVDFATNYNSSSIPDVYREMGCQVFLISCSRSPIRIGNLFAIKQIYDLVTENKYDLVHCHTPIAAMCTRIACRSLRKQGVKVIYTAHGFHFYKGAPLKNWLFYYPVEKLCSYWTDTLVTITKEDYELACRKLKAKRVEYIPGVGIDVDKFNNTVIDRKAKREELGVPRDAFLLLSVGELNVNKNHRVVIEALGKLRNPNIHYCIAGKGDQKEPLLTFARTLSIENQVHLLGYRSDVAELYKTADAYILPSIREGLNVSLMEAMASGLPCIVSNIRGNIDFHSDGVISCGWKEIDAFAEEICKLYSDRAKLQIMGGINRDSSNKYDVQIINAKMLRFYKLL